jgi:hypothetical protein
MRNLTKYINYVDGAIHKFEREMDRQDAKITGFMSLMWMAMVVGMIGCGMGLAAAVGYFFFNGKSWMMFLKISFGVLCLACLLGFITCVWAALAVPALYAVCQPTYSVFDDHMEFIRKKLIKLRSYRYIWCK